MSWCLNLHWDLFVDVLAMQSGEETVDADCLLSFSSLFWLIILEDVKNRTTQGL